MALQLASIPLPVELLTRTPVECVDPDGQIVKRPLFRSLTHLSQEVVDNSDGHYTNRASVQVLLSQSLRPNSRHKRPVPDALFRCIKQAALQQVPGRARDDFSQMLENSFKHLSERRDQVKDESEVKKIFDFDNELDFDTEIYVINDLRPIFRHGILEHIIRTAVLALSMENGPEVAKHTKIVFVFGSRFTRNVIRPLIGRMLLEHYRRMLPGLLQVHEGENDKKSVERILHIASDANVLRFETSGSISEWSPPMLVAQKGSELIGIELGNTLTTRDVDPVSYQRLRTEVNNTSNIAASIMGASKMEKILSKGPINGRAELKSTTATGIRRTHFT